MHLPSVPEGLICKSRPFRGTSAELLDSGLATPGLMSAAAGGLPSSWFGLVLQLERMAWCPLTLASSTRPLSTDGRGEAGMQHYCMKPDFLQHFNCTVWPWKYSYFKWLCNDFFFSSFMCNLAGEKRMQLNFISNRNVLHQLRIEAWP